MSDPSQHTLYANTSQTRFYWIPNDLELPGGTYVLRSLTGARVEVDEASVDPYKITEDRAKEVTKEVVTAFTKRAGSFLSGLGAMMQEVAKKQQEPKPRPTTQDARPDDPLGATSEQINEDPDAVIAGLKRIWEGLQATAKEAVDSGKEVDAATRERVRKLAAAAGDNLDAAEETVDELRDKFREFLASPELVKRIDEATKKLRELAEELGETFRPEGNRPAEEPPGGDNRPAEE